jgi:glycosyltransferase involved in cell wall biosynthesis/GT2 family glycosyltransferase
MNLFALSQMANFGAASKQRSCPILVSATSDIVSELNGTYRAAKHLLKSFRPSFVIDFNGASGVQLSPLVELLPEAHLVAVGPLPGGDATPNTPKLTRLVNDLQSYRDLERLHNHVRPIGPTLLICSRRLEQLQDPRPLLRMLRALLIENPENRLLLAATDREQQWGADYRGLPPDSSEVRNWSARELTMFLELSGFQILDVEPLPAEKKERASILLTLKANQIDYREHLVRLGLPPATIQYLLCSSEHADCKITGGIGAYAAQLLNAASPDEIGFLFAGDQAHVDSLPQIPRGWILPRLFLPERLDPELSSHDKVLESVRIVAFLYPELKTIELQDYQALGLAAVLAKRSGLIPSSIAIKIRCHGSVTYLEQCFSEWRGIEQLRVVYEEKVALENADVVSFPSRFLKSLYERTGYRLSSPSIEIRRYPFNFDPVAHARHYQSSDTLIFFGKRTEMKGFPLFIEALKILRSKFPGTAHLIKRILVIGKKDPSLLAENTFLAELNDQWQVIEFEGSRSEALQLIANYADQALCLLPYSGDNYPVSMLEVISAGCQFLAARSGGLPEMIPPELQSQLLHERTPESLARAIQSALALPATEKARLAHGCLEYGRAQHQDGWGSLIEMIESKASSSGRPPTTTKRSSVGVIVPYYNTALDSVRELLIGLNNQLVPPDLVCFVDDGSSVVHHRDLKDLLKRHLRVPYKLVEHVENRGLAAARNTGLSALDTDYVVNIDADDIPLPNFIKSYRDYLDANPTASAVTCWLASFKHGDDWGSAVNVNLIYRPIGDGLMLAQVDNCLGHANSCFRRDTLVSLGGWDAEEKTMWEDWALYLKMISRGLRLGVIPESVVLYRVTPGSMARTYQQFPAMNRLARQISSLPLFEPFRLQALMRSYRRLRDEQVVTQQRLSELEQRMDEYLHLRQLLKRFLRLDRTGTVASAAQKAMKRLIASQK